MIDVRGNDGAPARDFLPNEFRCDLARNVCTERFARMLLTKIVSVVAAAVGCGAAVSGARRTAICGYRRWIRVPILANRDEFHFRRDDSLARIIQLRDGMT